MENRKKDDEKFLARDFYQYLVSEGDILHEANKEVDQAIQKLIDIAASVKDSKELKEIVDQRDQVFGAIAKLQEESFCLGFRYGGSMVTLNNLEFGIRGDGFKKCKFLHDIKCIIKDRKEEEGKR